MNNSLEIFNFGNNQVRSVVDDYGEIWFVGKDVSDALGYANHSKALQDHVDDEDKLNNKTLSSLGQRGAWLINESGVYSLVFGSKLESAKRFKRWVTSEVLPAIRKHNMYQKPLTELEQIQLLAKGTTQLNERVDEIETKVVDLIEKKPVSATDYGAIGEAVKQKVYQYASIHKIEKSKRSPLFKDINSQIKQLTGAGNRSRILSRDYDKVIEFIGIWEPSTVTKSLIED